MQWCRSRFTEKIHLYSEWGFFFWLVCFVVIFLWSWREPTFRFEMSEWYRLPCIINLSDSSSCRMHSFRSQVLLLDLLSYMLVCIYIFCNLKLWKNISRYRPHGISILWKKVIDLELFYYFFFLNFVISEFYADFKSFCNNRIKHVLIRFYVNEDMSIILRLTKNIFPLIRWNYKK